MGKTENDHNLGKNINTEVPKIIDAMAKFIKSVFQAGCDYIKETDLIEKIRKKKADKKV